MSYGKRKSAIPKINESRPGPLPGSFERSYLREKAAGIRRALPKRKIPKLSDPTKGLGKKLLRRK